MIQWLKKWWGGEQPVPAVAVTLVAPRCVFKLSRLEGVLAAIREIMVASSSPIDGKAVLVLSVDCADDLPLREALELMGGEVTVKLVLAKCDTDAAFEVPQGVVDELAQMRQQYGVSSPDAPGMMPVGRRG